VASVDRVSSSSKNYHTDLVDAKYVPLDDLVYFDPVESKTDELILRKIMGAKEKDVSDEDYDIPAVIKDFIKQSS